MARNLKFGPLNPSFEPVNTAKITKETDKIDTLKVNIYSKTEFTLDETINFYDRNENLKFVGSVSKIENNLNFNTLEIKGLALELTTEIFSNVYRNSSPEAIIEDIITTQTDLTFNSTLSTGILIDKIVFRDEKLIDAIQKLMQLFKGRFSVSKTGVFTLTRNFDVKSSIRINSNDDVLSNKWKYDANKKYSKIVVQGANIDQRTVDDTNIGSFTQITLDAAPKDIKITNSAGTVLTQTTSTIDGDYEVDVQAQTIDFEVSQTDPIVEYTYESQIKVEIGSGRTLKLQKTYIESQNEALNLALSALDLYEDGVQTSKWLKTDGSDHEDVNVGEKINVFDNQNNINTDFEVQKIEFEYPNKLFITVGEDEDSIFDWQKESQQRIRELEQKDQNSDFVTLFDFIRNRLNVSVETEIVALKERTYFADTFYLLEDPFASRNQMLDDGTGPVMRETGYDEDNLLLAGSLTLENGDNLVTEGGDDIILD